jgi:rhodanese-related sulfurtransferase
MPTSLDRIALLGLKAQGRRLTVLDIRDRDPFAAGHRSGAINIPFDELETRARIDLPPHDTVVVDCERIDPFYCESASWALLRLGFPFVSIVGNGSVVDLHGTDLAVWSSCSGAAGVDGNCYGSRPAASSPFPGAEGKE